MKIVFYIECKQPIDTNPYAFLPYKKVVSYEIVHHILDYKCYVAIQYLLKLHLNIIFRVFTNVLIEKTNH